MSDRIHVAIRVRPLNQREQQFDEVWQYDSKTITPLSPETGRPVGYSYNFDQIYGQNDTSYDIYRQSASEVVRSAMEGINGTIFAYGQTSSGKTFTMKGNHEHPGIIPLAIQEIFQYIENNPSLEFLLRVSYMEIYNEVISDLLVPENTNLPIHEHIQKGVYVGKLKEEIVTSPEDVMQLMAAGEVHRHVGSTNMNEHSSRSHTIFRMVIESREKDSNKENDATPATAQGRNRGSLQGGAFKQSLLNLVDLAGSERAGLTGAEGQRLKEGAHINKSLLTLQRVIAQLSEGQAQHVPFRDSKLTRILQPALGGNARTTIVCTMTPASCFMDESLTTLKFANSAKNIRTKPKVNEVLDDKTLLRRYQKQIAQMEQELEKYKTQALTAPVVNIAPSQPMENAAVVATTAPESPRANIAAVSILSPLDKRMSHHQDLLARLSGRIVNSKTLKTRENNVAVNLFGAPSSRNTRRQTWCPSKTAGTSLLDGSFVGGEFDDEDIDIDEDSLEEALLNPQLDIEIEEHVLPPIDVNLNHNTEQVESLKAKVAQLEGELASSTEKNSMIENLQSKVAELEASLASAQSALQASEQDGLVKQQLTEKISALESQLATSREQESAIEEIFSKFGALESQLTTALDELALSQKENTEIKQEFEDKVAKLQSQVVEAQQIQVQEPDEEMVQKLSAAESEIAQLREKVAECEEQLRVEIEIHEEVQSQLIEEHSKREQELEEQIESLNADAAQFRERFEAFGREYSEKEANINQQLDLARASLEAAHSKNKLADEENAKLRAQIEQLQQEVSTFNQRTEEQQLEVQKVAWDLEIREKEFKDVEAERNSLKATVSALQEQLEQLQQQQQTRVEIPADWTEEREKLTVAFAELEKNSAEEREKLLAASVALEERVAEVEAKYELLAKSSSEELDAAQSKLASLEDEYKRQNEVVTTKFTEQLEQLVSERDNFSGQVQELKSQMGELEKVLSSGSLKSSGNIMDLATRLLSAENAGEQIRIQLSTVTAERDQLKVTCSEMVSEVSKLRSEVESLSSGEKRADAIKIANENMANEHQRVVESLRTELRASQDQYQTKVAEYQRDITNMETQIKSLKENNEKLSIDISMAQAKEETAKQEAETLRARVKSLEAESLDNNSAMSKSDLDSQQTRKKISQLQAQADLYSQTNEKLERQVKELQQEKRNVDAKLYNLQTEVEDLRTAKQKMEANQRSANNNSLLESQISDIKRKYTQENAELERELARLRPMAASAAALEVEVQEVTRQLEKAKAEKKDIMSDANDIASRLKKLKDAHEQLESQYSVAQMKLQNHEAALASAEEAEQKLRQEIKRIRDEADHRETTTRRDKMQLQTTVDQHEMTIKQLRCENEKLDQQLTEFSTQMDGWRAHVEELQSQLRALEQTRNDSSSELQTLQSENNNLNQQLKLLKQRYDSETKQLRDEVAQTKKDMKASTTQKAAWEKDKDKFMKEHEKMLEKVEKAENKFKQVAQEKSSLMQEKAEQQRELVSLRSGQDTLKKQLDKAENLQRTAEARLKEMEKQVQAMEKDLAANTKNYERASAQAESLQNEASRAKSELDNSRAQAESLRQQLNTVRMELANLQLNMEKERDAHAQSCADADHLRSELAHAVQAFQDCEVRLEATSLALKKSEDLVAQLQEAQMQLETERNDLVTEANATITSLSEQVNNLIAEKEQLAAQFAQQLENLSQEKEQLTVDFQQQLAALQAEKAHLVETQQHLETERTELVSKANESITMLQKELENIEAVKQTREQEIQKLNEDLVELMYSKEQADAAIEELQQSSKAEINAMKAELERSAAQLAESQDRCTQMQAELEAFRLEVTQALDAAQQNEAELNERIVEKDREIASLTARFESEFQQKQAQFDSSLAQLKSQLSEKENELAQVSSAFEAVSSALEQEKSNAELERTNTSAKMFELEQLVEEATNQISATQQQAAARESDLQARLHQAGQQITAKEAEIALSNEKLAKATHNIQSLDASIREKQQQVVELEAAVRNGEDASARLREQLQQMSAMQQSQQTNASSQVAKLNDLLNQAAADRAEVDRKLSASLTEISTLRNQLETIQRELNDAKEASEYHQREADEFQQLIAQQDEKMADYEKLKVDLEKLNSIHRTEMEETKRKYAGFIKKIQIETADQVKGLKERLAKATEQAQGYRERLERKHNEVNQLNMDVQTLRTDLQRVRERAAGGKPAPPAAVSQANKENL